MGDAASNYWRGLLAASRDKINYKHLDGFCLVKFTYFSYYLNRRTNVRSDCLGGCAEQHGGDGHDDDGNGGLDGGGDE